MSDHTANLRDGCHAPNPRKPAALPAPEALDLRNFHWPEDELPDDGVDLPPQPKPKCPFCADGPCKGACRD